MVLVLHIHGEWNRINLPMIANGGVGRIEIRDGKRQDASRHAMTHTKQTCSKAEHMREIRNKKPKGIIGNPSAEPIYNYDSQLALSPPLIGQLNKPLCVLPFWVF